MATVNANEGGEKCNDFKFFSSFDSDTEEPYPLLQEIEASKEQPQSVLALPLPKSTEDITGTTQKFTDSVTTTTDEQLENCNDLDRRLLLNSQSEHLPRQKLEIQTKSGGSESVLVDPLLKSIHDTSDEEKKPINPATANTDNDESTELDESEAESDEEKEDTNERLTLSSFGSDPEDPANLLPEIQKRRNQRLSVFPVAPLKPIHNLTDEAKKNIYEAVHLKLGFVFNHLFQVLNRSLPGTDAWGTASAVDFVGSWELVDWQKPTQGELFFHVQGRWDYGTTGPGSLGPDSLDSISTANIFDAYDPPFVLRNLYWEQGSPEAGWAFRIGKITPDAILNSSKHLNATTTFITTTGTGSFSNAHADSGLGLAAVWYPSDRFKILGLISDANGDRFNFGDIGAGDFYKSIELSFKPFPKTSKAGFWKLNFWHTDGTVDEQPINGSTGVAGWGFFFKLEQELSDDGNVIGLLRYGQSFKDAAIWRYLVGAALLVYDPFGPDGLQNDLIGLAFNWAEPVNPGSRGESNVELFYRFPLFPAVDFTLSYQSVIDPAFDPNNDHASAISFRIRSVF